jgi:hypothetical protein
VSRTPSSKQNGQANDGSTHAVAAAGEAHCDGGAPLLALGAMARLATLDDAEASTALLRDLDTWA